MKPYYDGSPRHEEAVKVMANAFGAVGDLSVGKERKLQWALDALLSSGLVVWGISSLDPQDSEAPTVCPSCNGWGDEVTENASIACPECGGTGEISLT